MKKIVILAAMLLVAVAANAQGSLRPRNETHWFDLRLSESFGLNSWHNMEFADGHLPRKSSTDLKAGINVTVIGQVGFFVDMGLGIMPGARYNDYNFGNCPVPKSGNKYYLRNITLDNGSPAPSASFKMTFGLTARLKASDKLYVLPSVGVGFMTLKRPGYDVALKEDGSNMQYTANYRWFTQNVASANGGEPTPGYLTGKLLFAHPVSPRLKLLFGVEYNWIFTPADFFVTFTNDFNTGINHTSKYRGNKLSMVGVTVGIAL